MQYGSSFLLVFVYLYSLFTDGVMFIILKDELVPKCIQQHEILIQNIATCSSPKEGEHITSNDYCVKQSALS